MNSKMVVQEGVEIIRMQLYRDIFYLYNEGEKWFLNQQGIKGYIDILTTKNQYVIISFVLVEYITDDLKNLELICTLLCLNLVLTHDVTPDTD